MLTPALNIQFSQISKIRKLYSKAEKQVFTKEKWNFVLWNFRAIFNKIPILWHLK